MIVVVGTAHIVDLSEKIEELLRNEMPNAICVELDMYRYIALKHNIENNNENVSKTFQKMAEFQKKVAEIFGESLGIDMLTAVEKGREIGADIYFIDKDIRETAEKINNISLKEKFKLLTGVFFGRKIKNKEDIENFLDEVSENSEEIIKEFRKSFPLLAKILIDDREEYMADRIKEISSRYEKVFVFVGEAHVEGLSRRLKNRGVQTKIIHLHELKK